jgi:hypothetical protein
MGPQVGPLSLALSQWNEVNALNCLHRAWFNKGSEEIPKPP